jgi:hypothetical protein
MCSDASRAQAASITRKSSFGLPDCVDRSATMA